MSNDTGIFVVLLRLAEWCGAFRDLVDELFSLTDVFWQAEEVIGYLEQDFSSSSEGEIVDALIANLGFEELCAWLAGCMDAVRAGMCLFGDAMTVKAAVGQIILRAIEEVDEDDDHLTDALHQIVVACMSFDEVVEAVATTLDARFGEGEE